MLLILHRSTLVAERLVGCRYLAMYHTLLSEGLSSRGEPAPALESLRAALELAYADLCRWMVGWGMWGDTTELQVSASCQRFLSALSLLPATASCQRVFSSAAASQRHVFRCRRVLRRCWIGWTAVMTWGARRATPPRWSAHTRSADDDKLSPMYK